MKLADMADKKASMMIQLNAVLISVIITYLGANMGKAGNLGPLMSGNPVLAIPISILLVTALGSVTTAILSAQPDVTSFDWLKKSPEIATNRRVNLLFFGQFTKLSLDNFQGGMREMMRQKDSHLHQHGDRRVLPRRSADAQVQPAAHQLHHFHGRASFSRRCRSALRCCISRRRGFAPVRRARIFAARLRSSTDRIGVS